MCEKKKYINKKRRKLQGIKNKKYRGFEPDVNRTRNLLIWSQTRYHCATDPLEFISVSIIYYSVLLIHFPKRRAKGTCDFMPPYLLSYFPYTNTGLFLLLMSNILSITLIEKNYQGPFNTISKRWGKQLLLIKAHKPPYSCLSPFLCL